MNEKRAVCLNCMDGRVQLPVISWIKDNHDLDYVDMITEPGMDGLAADAGNSIEDLNKKIRISLDKNNASIIFIAGHHDCKGNPVDDEVHKEHVQSAVKRLKDEFSDVSVKGLWVDEDWNVIDLNVSD